MNSITFCWNHCCSFSFACSKFLFFDERNKNPKTLLTFHLLHTSLIFVVLRSKNGEFLCEGMKGCIFRTFFNVRESVFPFWLCLAIRTSSDSKHCRPIVFCQKPIIVVFRGPVSLAALCPQKTLFVR